jgi:hypothetical protein
MMWTHASDAALMDVVEGTAEGRTRRHVAGCPQCRARVDEVRETLSLAADVAVPEPVAAYWPAMRRQVARGLEAEPAPRRALRPAWAGLAAAALAAIAAVILPGRLATQSPGTPATLAAATLPAWSALPPAEEDEGLVVLENVLPTIMAAAPAADCSDVTRCMVTLDEAESGALADELRAELAEGGSL